MRNFLVPIAASKNIENTLQYAIDLATIFDAKVFILGDYNVVARAGAILKVDKIIERETTNMILEIVGRVNTKQVSVKAVTAKGSLTDTVETMDNELDIDLVFVGANSDIKNPVFLASEAGSIIKRTEVPVIVVPNTASFEAPKTILTAFKSGIVKTEGVLKPLAFFKEKFDATVNLLLVKTPNYKDTDLVLDPSLDAIKTNFSSSENATTYQGVLERFRSHDPNMLCVFRRNRGFFAKLWEKNTILKSEFHSTIPLLVLSAKK